jgi:hypothetical protein
LADSGWLENCFPSLVASRFALVEAAYTPDGIDWIAFFGRYRSPVALDPCVEGFPLLVVHSSFVHLDRLFCAPDFSPE